jgi:hypothetical protein
MKTMEDIGPSDVAPEDTAYRDAERELHNAIERYGCDVETWPAHARAILARYNDAMDPRR